MCWLGTKDLTDRQMQAIAAEVNLTNTAFLKCDSGDFQSKDEFSIRWFTPTTEIKLNGHSTLAVAHSLFQNADNINQCLTFHTPGGVIYARRKKEALVLDFPEYKIDNIGGGDYLALLQCVFSSLVRNTLIADVKLSRSCKKLIIRMRDQFTVRDLEKLQPNFHRMLGSHKGKRYTGVIVTTKAEDGDDCHFYSRFFSPWEGVNEDPISVASHAILAPLWSGILGTKKMVGKSCSQRTGVVKMQVRENGHVELEGVASTILEGMMTVPNPDR